MFFYRGFAIHGSNEVPGRNASHGCVRVYKEDAQWLNEEFIDLPPKTGTNVTKVIIQPYKVDDKIINIGNKLIHKP